VIELCEWKRQNPKKSRYYLYQTFPEGREKLLLAHPKQYITGGRGET